MRPCCEINMNTKSLPSWANCCTILSEILAWRRDRTTSLLWETGPLVLRQREEQTTVQTKSIDNRLPYRGFTIKALYFSNMCYEKDYSSWTLDILYRRLRCKLFRVNIKVVSICSIYGVKFVNFWCCKTCCIFSKLHITSLQNALKFSFPVFTCKNHTLNLILICK